MQHSGRDEQDVPFLQPEYLPADGRLIAVLNRHDDLGGGVPVGVEVRVLRVEI